MIVDVATVGVPKAGVFAEGAARVVAASIVAAVRGADPPSSYDGLGSCYIEFGSGRVARFDADFLSGPVPTGTFNEPTDALVGEKRLFGSSRRARWSSPLPERSQAAGHRMHAALRQDRVDRSTVATVARAERKPRRNWIQEERRRTLGDWVAFCLACGHTLRYFQEFEGDLPDICPQCHGELRRRCPSCGARFPSAFLVDCEECSSPVREPERFGGPIRKPGR